MNEQEMRAAEVPSVQTLDELNSYIESLVQQKHDYGTAVYAMSMSAVATFNYVAGQLGVTGFQASCADLDILRRIRRTNGPFMVVFGERMLYPQYNIEEYVRGALSELLPWAADEARKLLAKADENVAPSVIRHWQELAAFAPKETAE